MQELEKILEEIDLKITGSMGKKREGLLEARNIIRKHLNDGWIPVEKDLPRMNQKFGVQGNCLATHSAVPIGKER